MMSRLSTRARAAPKPNCWYVNACWYTSSASVCVAPGGSAVGQGEDLVEDAQALDECEGRGDHDRRLDERENHVPEPAEHPGAVERSGLFHLDRHRRKSREVDHHDEADVLPDHHDQDAPDRVGGVCEPLLLGLTEGRHQLIQRTVVVEDELPDVRHRDRAHDHGHEHQRPQHVPRLQRAVQCEREEQPEDVGEDQEPDGEEERVPQRSDQLGRLEDLDEVLQADEVEIAEAGPVRESEESARHCGDVDHHEHQSEGRQGPPPRTESQVVRLRALSASSWTSPACCRGQDLGLRHNLRCHRSAPMIPCSGRPGGPATAFGRDQPQSVSICLSTWSTVIWPVMMPCTPAPRSL